ncbi:MAG: hypothetical protein ACYCQK_02080 [Acidiferrobacteraceae bacterium]
MLTILAACLSMAVRDALATVLTVAESRGRAVLAGSMDALGDVAGLATTYFGVDALLTNGLSAHTLLLIACIAVTSFGGTVFWTRWARRIRTVT